MSIVTASMHHSGNGRPIIDRAFLVNGEAVQVGAESNNRRGAANVNGQPGARGADARFEAQVTQRARHLRRGSLLLPGDLRMAVDVSAQLNHLGGNLAGKARKISDRKGHGGERLAVSKETFHLRRPLV